MDYLKINIIRNLEDRIRYRLSELKKEHPNITFSQAWLAREANVSRAAVSKWLSGETKEIRGDTLNRAAKALKCSPEWLAGVSEHDNPSEKIVVPDYPTIAILEDMDNLDGYVMFDMYDVKLSAGNGAHATWIARKDEPLAFREAWTRKRGFKPEQVKGLYVRGDSMEPFLKDWDTVLIDTSDIDIVSGEIYAVNYKNNLFIKEARMQPDGLQLISYNPKYDPIKVTEEDAERFQVLGQMVWRGG